MGNSTQLINQARAFLLERGIAVPQGKQRFAVRLPEILEDADNGLPDEMRALLAGMLAEWEVLEEKIQQVNRYLLRKAQASEACVRLREIPGIGAQTATALVAAIGNGEAFEKGRDVAAWLGLVPREYSTGGKQRLGGISKRGNRSQCTLLSCRSPSFSPTSTCVASPWRVEYTGAQMTVENRESISACRLTMTNTRKRFGSRAGGLATR